MSIDIIYAGLFLNCFVKRRTKKFFNSPQFKNRNNVFVDTYKHNTYHIKKNAIHMFVCPEDPTSIMEICKYLEFVFRRSFIGVRIDESLYKQFENICMLNWVRL